MQILVENKTHHIGSCIVQWNSGIFSQENINKPFLSSPVSILSDKMRSGVSLAMYIITWLHINMGAQWLSCRVLDSRQKCLRFKPHRFHCVVSLSKTH